jgi:hypothetical protein
MTMDHTFKLAIIPCALLAGAFALGACRVQVTGPKRYEGTAKTVSAAWATGKIVTINNGNGSVSVDTASPTSEVSVTGAPFAIEPDDDPGKQTALTEMNTKLLLAATPDANGNVSVSGNGTGTYGFELTVHLPTSFDGPLSVTSGNGPVKLATSPTSPSTTINGSAGDIDARNLAGTVVIKNGAGGIAVSATPSGSGNSIKTDVGDINARISPQANLTITATTAFGGSVTPAQGTTANLSPDKMSASITLGDGTGVLVVSTGNGNVIFQ